MSGEANQADPVTVEECKRKLSRVLESYVETDIYNADETSLFFKLLPGRSMVLSKDTCKGEKHSKERYTILLYTNWFGIHMLTSLVIGKR